MPKIFSSAEFYIWEWSLKLDSWICYSCHIPQKADGTLSLSSLLSIVLKSLAASPAHLAGLGLSHGLNGALFPSPAEGKVLWQTPCKDEITCTLKKWNLWKENRSGIWYLVYIIKYNYCKWILEITATKIWKLHRNEKISCLKTAT